MKVLNMGSCNIDYIYEVDHMVKPGETQSVSSLQVVSGGKGLNQSIALAKAGVNVYHAGLIGADGGILKEALISHGANCEYLKEVDEKSGHAIIQIDRRGENCILVYPGANHCFTEAKVDEILSDFNEGDLLLLQNEINLMDYIVKSAHERGLKIALNPAPFNDKVKAIDLSLIDYLVVNEIEGCDLANEEDESKVIDTLKSMYPQTHILLTLGSKGCLYTQGEMVIKQEAYKVEAVDTTAAGDTFIGYFIAGLVEGYEIKECLELAARASSITVTRKGSSSSIPTIEEVRQL